MQQKSNDSGERYSQERRMMDYLNLTDTFTKEQKEQVNYFLFRNTFLVARTPLFSS